MEKYDELETFERVESWPAKVESWPTIEEIERRLRKLGCAKEQVRRHLDQVVMSRVEAAKLKPRLKGR
jgi:predicted transcriptional regulator